MSESVSLIKSRFSYCSVEEAISLNKLPGLYFWNGKKVTSKHITLDNGGYAQINMWPKAKRPCFYAIHRIVWILHNGEIPDGFEVNHNDGNRLNSPISNLSLLTQADNVGHRSLFSEKSNCGLTGCKQLGKRLFSSKITINKQLHEFLSETWQIALNKRLALAKSWYLPATIPVYVPPYVARAISHIKAGSHTGQIKFEEL